MYKITVNYILIHIIIMEDSTCNRRQFLIFCLDDGPENKRDLFS